MRSSNPTLNDQVFRNAAGTSSSTMTVQGTVNKSCILLLLLWIPAVFIWNNLARSPLGAAPTGYMTGAAIIGLVLALATTFKPNWSPLTAPLYAIVEGVFLGALSFFFEQRYGNIVFQAVLLTFGTLFTLLFAYRSGMIKVTDKFRSGIMAATGGIFLVYMVTFLLGLFGVQVPFIHSGGMFGIAFAGFVVVIAALNLLLDFDLIEQGARSGAPKYMEWYGGFALMVTLVWLYISILRLLALLRDE